MVKAGITSGGQRSLEAKFKGFVLVFAHRGFVPSTMQKVAVL